MHVEEGVLHVKGDDKHDEQTIQVAFKERGR